LALEAKKQAEETNSAVGPAPITAEAPTATTAAETVRVGGYVLLSDLKATWKDKSPCSGSGPYADMRQGTTVAFLGQNGAVAESKLLAGEAIDVQGRIRCMLIFAPIQVPVADQYTVKVGSRDGVDYDLADFKALGEQPLTLFVGDTDEKAPPPPAADEITAEGTLLVPSEVKPGTYRATVPGDAIGCYWARLNAPDDSFEAIIANGNGSPGERMTVTIRKSDKAFQTRGCGTWKKIG
jgi:hypothetical protein